VTRLDYPRQVEPPRHNSPQRHRVRRVVLKKLTLRPILHMATLSATQCNPVIHNFLSKISRSRKTWKSSADCLYEKIHYYAKCDGKRQAWMGLL